MNKSFIFRFEVEAKFGAFYTGGTVAWTSDGEELLCQDQHRINVISVNSNTVQRSIADSNDKDIEVDYMYTFALSPNDVEVISSHKSGLLKLWQRADGVLVKQWKAIHQGPVPQLIFNGKGNIIASGGTDSSVRLWDYDQKVCLGALRGCQGVISVLRFQPFVESLAERLLIASGDDNRIHCWNYETKELKFILSGHFSRITDVSFSSDGFSLVSSGRDKVLILWNLRNGSQVRTVPVYESLEGAVVIDHECALPGGKF